MNAAYMLGRILLPLIFLGGGNSEVDEHPRRSPRCSPPASMPIPTRLCLYLGSIPKYEALGYLVAAIEIICGLMVLIGLKARWGALVLIVFTACTIIFVHHFWDMEGEASQNRDRRAEEPVDHGRAFAGGRRGLRAERRGPPLNGRAPHESRK